MLYDKNPPIKTYEELFREAVSQIPVYSSQWTNFNESDPGITILQNFAAFHQLQQESIYEETRESRLSLFKLLGMEPEKDVSSRIMVEPVQAAKTEYVIPIHEKLIAGEGIFYETDKHIHLKKNRLFQVYARQNGGEIKDLSQILKRDTPISSLIFGEAAKPGAAVYFCFLSLPPTSGELHLYIKVDNRGKRNPCSRKQIPPFASLRWQCYTQDGWEDMKAWDKTGYFLWDGEIKLRMPSKKAAWIEDKKAAEKGDANEKSYYAIRCCLEKSSYDYPPGVFYISDCAFMAVQRHTLAACFSGSGPKITVHSGLVCDGYYQVFVREEGQEDYRLYQRADEDSETGRFYRLIKEEGNCLELSFDRQAFQYGPDACQDAVRVICYSEEIVNQRLIGTVYGYENQVLNMHQIEHVLTDSFELMAELTDGDGEKRFRFIKPGCQNDDSLGYELLPDEGEVRIYHPGFGQECRLYLCSCALTKGEEGSLRTGAFLHTAICREGESSTFINIGTQKAGRSVQTLQEMEIQLKEDMQIPSRAVTAKDYEWFVKHTPGLCIDCVSAAVKGENQVEIIVKPKCRERFGQLTRLYREEILHALESRRMLGTSITLKQPVYAPIRIKGRICIRETGKDSLLEIRKVLKEELDFDSGHLKFGRTISFHNIYKRILCLDFVEFIQDLVPEVGRGGFVQGMEIRLDDDSLGYLDGLDIQCYS